MYKLMMAETYLHYMVINTYGTLNIFLLSIQTNFYIILSSYVERHTMKKSSLSFMFLIGFQAYKMWMLFWKISCPRDPFLEFSNSLQYNLEKSRELTAFIS